MMILVKAFIMRDDTEIVVQLGNIGCTVRAITIQPKPL